MHISLIHNKLKYITGILNTITQLIYQIHSYSFWEKYSGGKKLCREEYSKWEKLQGQYFTVGKNP